MFLARALAVVGLTSVVFAAGVLHPVDAFAQQVFRFVAPDGRVTFTDLRPLEAGANATAAAIGPARPGGSDDMAGLPFELRQAAAAYPVTLFSGPECAPCVQGRALLTNRGIPFTEKTVSTNEDIGALKRLIGTPTLPVLTIGGQQLKGYSEVEWRQYLDAAGYPSSSQLPASYRQPSPAPLVATQDVKPVRPATAEAAPAARRATAPAPQPENDFQF